MQCDILSIGDELLIGQIVNTNAAWLGRELTGLGLTVRKVTVVGDDKDSIVTALREGITHAGSVFVTGGLGPTKDDMTKDALIEVFGGTLVFHEETWDRLCKILERFGKTPVEAHRQQCMLPSRAQILPNRMGTAPGLLFEASGCRVVVMPGVPYEMEYIMQTHVLPTLIAQATTGRIVYRTICTVGEGESVLAEKIADIEASLPQGLRIAYLPSPGRVRIRVTGTGADHSNIDTQVRSVTSQITERVAEFVYASEDISLAEAIGRRLREEGKTLTLAESCTGGYLAHLVTAIAGSSDYFPGGIITYSNAMKSSHLGVNTSTLAHHGAVSEATVREMVSGVKRMFGTDYAIAVSGVAGPGGGTEDKPVGTVWIAVTNGTDVFAQKFLFGKDRLRNIELSAVYALDLLRKRFLRS